MINWWKMGWSQQILDIQNLMSFDFIISKKQQVCAEMEVYYEEGNAQVQQKVHKIVFGSNKIQKIVSNHYKNQFYCWNKRKRILIQEAFYFLSFLSFLYRINYAHYWSTVKCIKYNAYKELRQKRKMLARAKRQFNVPDQSEGESTDQSTLTNVSRISCPRILNTLQVKISANMWRNCERIISGTW